MFDFFYHIVSSRTRFGISFFFQKGFWFFLPHHVILNLIQDLTFFQKGFWIFFLSLLCFYFFHKNYYHFTKRKEPARSPKPAVLNLSYLQWIYLPVWLRLASTGLLFLQVKAKQLLAQSFLTLFLLYKQRCKARSLCLG